LLTELFVRKGELIYKQQNFWKKSHFFVLKVEMFGHDTQNAAAVKHGSGGLMIWA